MGSLSLVTSICLLKLNIGPVKFDSSTVNKGRIMNFNITF